MNEPGTRPETPDYAADINAPAPHLLLLESRIFAELPLFLLHGDGDGDGHAVVVLPGFGADDLTAAPCTETSGLRGSWLGTWTQPEYA